jgi:hypothetical protein
MQRTRVSSGDLVVSSCNSGIGIGVAAIVASLVGNINGTSVQPPIRHPVGKTNPAESANASAERNHDTLSFGKVKLDLNQISDASLRGVELSLTPV